MGGISRRSWIRTAGAGAYAGAAPQGAEAPHESSRARRFRRERPACLDVSWNPEPSFIWHAGEAVYYENPRNRFCYFRKTFELPGSVSESELRILADTRYQLFVNGRYIARGPSRYDPRWAYFDVHDVKACLRPGRNVLAVLVLFHGYGTGAQASVMQSLLVHARFQHPGGETFVVSDASWKARIADAYDSAAPRLNGRQGPMEVLDLSRLEDGWTLPEFDDSRWSGTAVMRPGLSNTPWFHLVRRDIPLLEEGRLAAAALGQTGECELEIPAVARLGVPRRGVRWTGGGGPWPESGVVCGGFGSSRAAVLNVDFGRIDAGYLQLEVEAPQGGVIDATYAEALWKGMPPLPHGSAISCDRFILKRGSNRMEVAFGWKAWRYLQLWVWSDEPVRIRAVSMRTVKYPAPETTGLSVASDLWDRVIRIATHTLKICRQDAFLDSPSREQQQWIGDSRKQAITCAYLFGDTALWRRLLEQIGQSQDWTGAILPRHPGRHENISPIPAFSLAWVSAFWDYYWYTGSAEEIRRWWPNLLQAIRWFTAFENSQGLLEDVPHWMFLDWGELPHGPSLPNDRSRGIFTVLNLMYVEALGCMSRMGVLAGDPEASRYFSRSCARLKRAVSAHLWDREHGIFTDGCAEGKQLALYSEPGNSLALLHLDLPAEQACAVIANAFERPSVRVVKGSPNFVFELCRALSRHKRADLAARLLGPRYARMLEQGATATWERWGIFDNSKTEPPGAGSASHGWGGAVNTFFVESVLGFHIVSPGASEVLIEPATAGFESARGTVMTVRGPVAIEWTNRGGRFSLSVEAPAGMRGVVRTPEGKSRRLSRTVRI